MTKPLKNNELNIAPSKTPVVASVAVKVAAPVALYKTPRAAKVPGGAKKSSGRSRALDDGCREVACESSMTTAGYCRLHYIKNWKKIKRKELILREKKLNQYIEELVSKYPYKFLEAIRGDLAEDKAFAKVIYDLELDDSIDDVDGDEEADEAVIENIRRDFDDDSDF